MKAGDHIHLSFELRPLIFSLHYISLYQQISFPVPLTAEED